MRPCGSDLFHRPLAAPVIEDYGRNQALLSPALELLLPADSRRPYSSSRAIDRISWPRESLVRAAVAADPKTWVARPSPGRPLGAAAKSREIQAAYREAKHPDQH